MKKILLMFLALVTIVTLSACGDDTPEVPVDESPVITGADDVTIEKGSTFLMLDGVTASDEEDGDLTADIEVSGTVFTSALGEYELTYKVTDSAGNETTVTRTITVVYTDVEAPIVSGVSDVEIVIGSMFDPLSGVTAADTVDGDLTEAITVSGSVNVWVPGEYTVNYTVEDLSGNAFTGSRVVTVGFGRIVFAESNLVMNGEFADTSSWAVTDGTMTVVNDELEIAPGTGEVVLSQSGIGVTIDEDATETMVKVMFKAYAAGTESVSVSLVDGDNVAMSGEEVIDLTDTLTDYVVYLKVKDNAMTDGVLSFDFGTITNNVYVDGVVVYASSEKDIVVPEINNAEGVVFIPIDADATLVEMLLKEGVSAVDDLDGLISDSIVITHTVDTSSLGMHFITYTVSDAAGNTATVERIALTTQLIDLGVLEDPTFDGTELEANWGTEGAGGNNTPSIVDGALVMDIGDSAGEWTSHTKMYINGLGSETFKEGYTYVLQYDAKAEQDRIMNIRAGLGLNGDPWIHDFTGGNKNIAITSEWDTYYVIFTVDEATHENMINDAANPVFKFEFNMGVVTWGEEEKNNDVSLDNIYIYEINQRTTNAIQDEDFSNFGEEGSVWAYEAGGDANVPFVINENGELEVQIGANGGGWSSHTKLYQAAGETAFEYGRVYRMDITVKAEKARTIEVKLGDKLWADPWIDLFTGGLVNLNISEEFVTYSIYFTADKEGHASSNGDKSFEINMGPVTWGDEELNNTITFQSITVIEYLSNDDITRPELAGLEDIVVDMNGTVDYVTGVTATDDVDGDITANIMIDDSAVDLTTAGTYYVTYTVTDAAGNMTTGNRKVDVLDPNAPAYVDFLSGETLAVETVSGGEATSLYNAGVLEVTLGNVIGDWGSATKLKVANTPLAADTLYKMTVTVKADTARQSIIRFGEALSADPWVMDYTGSTQQFEIGTEYQTLEFLFVTDQGVGSNVIEFQLGSITWGGEEKNNVIYISDFRLDKLEDDTQAPSLHGSYGDVTVSTDVTFDPMNGVWASDNTKLVDFTVTGTVDQTTPGTYALTYTATDFVGNETVHTRNVTVVDFTGATQTDLMSLVTTVENGEFLDNGGVLELSTGGDIGGWDSYVKVKIENITVTQGNTYRFVFTVKADQARNIGFRIGESLWADPWIDNYTGGHKITTVGTDYVTYEVVFTADKAGHASSNGYNVLEIHFGPITWGGEEYNNTVYLQDFVIEELPTS